MLRTLFYVLPLPIFIAISYVFRVVYTVQMYRYACRQPIDDSWLWGYTRWEKLRGSWRASFAKLEYKMFGEK